MLLTRHASCWNVLAEPEQVAFTLEIINNPLVKP
jgi:hypothetical protein